MAKYDFQRETRTPYSECYIVTENEVVVGRLDIHYADVVVHATLNIEETVTSNDIQDLIDDIEAELLDAVGIVRQEMIIHVHQGRELGVYTTSDFDGANGGGFRFN